MNINNKTTKKTSLQLMNNFMIFFFRLKYHVRFEGKQFYTVSASNCICHLSSIYGMRTVAVFLSFFYKKKKLKRNDGILLFPANYFSCSHLKTKIKKKISERRHKKIIENKSLRQRTYNTTPF